MPSTPTPDATDKLDEAQVRHVAKLARLKLADADIARYSTQLTAILGYVAQLKSVQVDGVEPMAHPLPLKNVLREDIVRPSLTTEQVLGQRSRQGWPLFRRPHGPRHRNGAAANRGSHNTKQEQSHWRGDSGI